MIEEVTVSEAKEELKRADHSIYVTLKYTKTADVIKNIIKRLIVSFDLAMNDLIDFLQEKKKMKDIPPSKRAKAQEIMKKIPGLKDHMQTYLVMRKIDVAPFTKREEYRKHVTLIAKVSLKETREVNIDVLRQYFMKTGEFVECVDALRSGLTKLSALKG